jgi:hypothetical protein
VTVGIGVAVAAGEDVVPPVVGAGAGAAAVVFGAKFSIENRLIGALLLVDPRNYLAAGNERLLTRSVTNLRKWSFSRAGHAVFIGPT